MSAPIPALPNKDLCEWALALVGIPFLAGGRESGALDCWGLLCRVYRERLGIEIPLYSSDYSAALARVCADPGESDALGWVQLAKPAHLCVVAMSCRGAVLHHVGVFLDIDGGRVLHATEPHSAIQKLGTLRDLGYHTFRFYGRTS